MSTIIKGKVWKFGDNIDTDALHPAPYADFAEARKHVLESVNPRFAGEVKPGDVLVAGNNFGCGSSRETAPTFLKSLGVGAVVAESFARIFFRNAAAIGLPIAACPSVSEIFEEGNELELDLNSCQVKNLTTGKSLQATPLPAEMLAVLSKGGIVPLLKEMVKKGEI